MAIHEVRDLEKLELNLTSIIRRLEDEDYDVTSLRRANEKLHSGISELLGNSRIEEEWKGTYK